MKNLYKEELEKALGLLKETEYFINFIPNTKYNGKSYEKSYELASDLRKFLKQYGK